VWQGDGSFQFLLDLSMKAVQLGCAAACCSVIVPRWVVSGALALCAARAAPAATSSTQLYTETSPPTYRGPQPIYCQSIRLCEGNKIQRLGCVLSVKGSMHFGVLSSITRQHCCNLSMPVTYCHHTGFTTHGTRDSRCCAGSLGSAVSVRSLGDAEWGRDVDCPGQLHSLTFRCASHP
jgi:hypothetical protein